MAVASRVAERLSSGLKRYQPILASAKARDVNESDTSMIVADVLADVFGYDKYSEVTRELCIRGTFCDLATRIDGKFQLLIEVKAIGLDLKDAHIKQAVDYAANQGIEWVALTNGNTWKVFRVIFGKPIDCGVGLGHRPPLTDVQEYGALGKSLSTDARKHAEIWSLCLP